MSEAKLGLRRHWNSRIGCISDLQQSILKENNAITVAL